MTFFRVMLAQLLLELAHRATPSLPVRRSIAAAGRHLSVEQLEGDGE